MFLYQGFFVSRNQTTNIYFLILTTSLFSYAGFCYKRSAVCSNIFLFDRSMLIKNEMIVSLQLLTLSRWRPISYRNQSIDLQSKSMDWFLYDIGLHRERINIIKCFCLKFVINKIFTMTVNYHLRILIWKMNSQVKLKHLRIA